VRVPGAGPWRGLAACASISPQVTVSQFPRRLPALTLALAFVGVSLTLRATVDHGFVTLYTGDNGESYRLAAARNFEKFGFVAMKFLPVLTDIPGATLPEVLPYYTHSPPLPYLLVAAPYIASGGSVFAARLLVILMSLAGLYFATRAAQAMVSGLAPGDEGARARVLLLMPLFLATSAGVLCYGDALTEVPMQQTVQWMLLLACARFLATPGAGGSGTLAALGALQMWIGLEWILPVIVALGYCVLTRPLASEPRRRALLIVFGLGVAAPLCLRLAQNAWALGGVMPALEDVFHRALFRTGGDAAYPYSLGRHLGRFAVATAWLSGFAAPLLIGLDLHDRARRKREAWNSTSTLFVLWGLGSLSFQFLMPQAALFHAATSLHPANFILLWGALAAARLWPTRPKAVAAILALQLLSGGVLWATEIGIPFLRGSSTELAGRLCGPHRAELQAAIPEMSSSVSKMIGARLDATAPARECGAGSEAAKSVLWTYLRVIRVSSLE
jgi:hypothetical protein